MKQLLILWFQTDTWFSRVIRWVSRSPYSHVGVYIDGTYYEATASLKDPRGMIRKLTGDEAELKLSEAAAFKYLPVNEVDAEQIKFFAESRVGNGYSVMGLILAGLAIVTGYRLVVAKEGEYICSGWVATLAQIGGYLMTKEARLESPASLAVALEPTTLKEGVPEARSAEVRQAAERVTKVLR